jgi:hypothetical protein
MIIIKADFVAGSEIKRSIMEAIAFGRKLQCAVSFRFNGVEMTAWPHSDADILVQEYCSELKENARKRYDI